MKRIGIDARLYFQTGVGVYLRNFLHYLQQMDHKEIEFMVYVMKSDSSKITFHNPFFIKREVTARWHSFSEQTSFYRDVMNDRLDLMHFTYFSYPVMYKRPFIATIHDLTPLLHKTGRASTRNPVLYEIKFRAFKYVLAQQVYNAAHIITPTLSVKKQLVEVYGKSIEHKTQHVYEGVNYEILEAKENKGLLSRFAKPFLLYVGNFYPHKNVDRLIKAFSMLNTDTELVMVGPDNFFANELKKEIDEKKIENIRFYHTPYIEDIVFFYKHARALVNPSLSEGFGLPLIEAAHFGTPIIASDLPVFKELFGDSFIAFDPSSTEDISVKLDMFLKKPVSFNYSSLLKKYSFEKMSKEILQLYRA